MTRNGRDWAARRRGEFNRSHGSHGLAAAIEARRRMNEPRAEGRPIRVDRIGPSDPRYAYLAQAHD